LRSDWQDLDRMCDEGLAGLHVSGLLHIAMTRLDDRIRVLERSVSLADADHSSRLGAAA
jgi:hypothetical protein